MPYLSASKQRALAGAILQRMGLDAARVTSLVIRFEPGSLITASVELHPAAEDLEALLCFDYFLAARPADFNPPVAAEYQVAEGRAVVGQQVIAPAVAATKRDSSGREVINGGARLHFMFGDALGLPYPSHGVGPTRKDGRRGWRRGSSPGLGIGGPTP
jgi:hypothetical protein